MLSIYFNFRWHFISGSFYHDYTFVATRGLETRRIPQIIDSQQITMSLIATYPFSIYHKARWRLLEFKSKEAPWALCPLKNTHTLNHPVACGNTITCKNLSMTLRQQTTFIPALRQRMIPFYSRFQIEYIQFSYRQVRLFTSDATWSVTNLPLCKGIFLCLQSPSIVHFSEDQRSRSAQVTNRSTHLKNSTPRRRASVESANQNTI
jgi:hypothetical protein